jgi:hypothetical protein
MGQPWEGRFELDYHEINGTAMLLASSAETQSVIGHEWYQLQVVPVEDII